MVPLPPTTSTRIECPADAQACFRMIADAPIEIVVVAYLNGGGQVIGLQHRAGEIDTVTLPAREVAIGALRTGATAVIVAHNHPSGDPTPSRSDLDHARAVSRALDAIGVRLVDHMVLAGERMASVHALGLL